MPQSRYPTSQTSQTSYITNISRHQYLRSLNIPYVKHHTSQTSHIGNIPYPEHPTNQTSHISNILHPKYLTSWTFHILNIPHFQHPTSKTSCMHPKHTTVHTSSIPNILHPEHPPTQTSYIPIILYPVRSIICLYINWNMSTLFKLLFASLKIIQIKKFQTQNNT